MSEINVSRDSKLIKVLAAQVNNQRVDSDKSEEAAQIINELAQDMNPQNMHQIAQIVGFTVDELQQKSLDFLNLVADIKNIGYGDKAAFKVRTGGIKAVEDNRHDSIGLCLGHHERPSLERGSHAQ